MTRLALPTPAALGASTVVIDASGAITVAYGTAAPLSLPAGTTVAFADAQLASPAGTGATGTVAIAPGSLAIGRAGASLTLRAGLAWTGSFGLSDAVGLDLGAYGLSLAGPVTFAAGPGGAPTVTATTGTMTTTGAVGLSGLALGGGAAWTVAGTVTQTGTLQMGTGTGSTTRLAIASGATFKIDADVGIAAQGTATLTNAGTLAKTGGTAVSHIAADTTSTGTLSVADGNLRFDGAQNSFSGLYVGPGMVDYGQGSTATLGTIAMTLGACTTNFGTVKQSGTVTMGDGSTIKTLAGRSWTFTGDAGIALAAGASTPLFTNLGLLAKAGGTGTTTVAVSAAIGGTTTIACGTLAFSGPSNTFTSAVSGAGTFALTGGWSSFDAGAAVTSAGFAMRGASAGLTVGLSYAGAFAMDAASSLLLQGNTLALSGTATLSGWIGGSGTLALSGAATVSGGIGGGATVQLGASASVAFGASQSGATLAFGAGAQTVTVAAGATLGDAVSGFSAGDTIDLAGIPYAKSCRAVFTAAAGGGTLRIVDGTRGNATLATLTLQGSYDGGVFTLGRDAGGGTMLGMTTVPPLGLQPGDVVTSAVAGGPLATVTRLNPDGSLLQENRVTAMDGGKAHFRLSGGSAFSGKPYAAVDTIVGPTGAVEMRTLFGANGAILDQTRYNADGSVQLYAVVSQPKAGQVLYHYEGGSFFARKPFYAYDTLLTSGGVLLGQEYDMRDGSHTFTAQGSNLVIQASANEAFTLLGSNETIAFSGPGFGAAKVQGFGAGDVLSFAKSVFADYDALMGHVSGTTSTLITGAGNDSVTLAGLAPGALDRSMFAFV